MAKNFFTDNPMSAQAGNGNSDNNSAEDAGTSGNVYDWKNASDRVKAPPRSNLADKVVTIKRAEIELPPQNKDWSKTRDGKKDYKYCTLKLYYDAGGQVESYSGIRVFKQDSGKESDPSITRDGLSQASALLMAMAKFKNLDINEIGMRTFMGFLNSMPKAKLKNVEVLNPTTMEKIYKNLVSEFVA